MKRKVKPKITGHGFHRLTPDKFPLAKGELAKKFTIPPFSVLNAREGIWQERKVFWKNLGIESEIGREGAKTYNTADWIKQKSLPGLAADGAIGTGTSIFDPALTELMYSWFCKKGGLIIDPFAGGSVRGIVAGVMKYNYWGCDLRQVQIDANYVQSKEIIDTENKEIHPLWVCGDSKKEVRNAPLADFLFTCPPYGDLEVYSKDKRDISNMPYSRFLNILYKIIKLSCKKLKEDTFAAVVVGDFRDKNGIMRNFVSDTIDIFIRSGLQYYNEMILATSVGSAPIRVSKQFDNSRKIAKVHQNVLVFVKGDSLKAAKIIERAKDEKTCGDTDI